MPQQVKDPAWSLLWHKFDPWPGNFHVPWAQPKKRERGGSSLRRKECEGTVAWRLRGTSSC